MLWVASLMIGLTTQYTYLSPIIGDGSSYVYAQQLDITSDDSITRYVAPNAPLNFLRYKPNDLVSLVESPFVRVQWGVWFLRREAFDELSDMAYHFHAIFNKRLVVVSSYRSFGLQNALFAGYTETHGLAAAGFSALPGHSEHQLWLAADLFTANSADVKGYNGYYDWLQRNAHRRWWIQSYQKWREVDGYVVEPWHWRYVWKELATLLYLKQMTFAEWVTKYKKVVIITKKL